MRPRTTSRPATPSPSMLKWLLVVSVTAAVIGVQGSSRTSRHSQRRRTYSLNRVVALDEVFLKLRFGSTGQDSFPCTSEVASLTSTAVRTCVSNYANALCNLPSSPSVSLGSATCASDRVVSIDGGSLNFAGSTYKPTSDQVSDCVAKVVESQQCLSILRQGLGSLYQVDVESQFTLEPTTFPTSPPVTGPPTRFPVAAVVTETPTAAQTSDAPSGSPTNVPTTLSPTSSAPQPAPTSSPIENTSVPTSAATSPAPVDSTMPSQFPTTTIMTGSGPVPAGAVSGQTNASTSRSAASNNLPMLIGVAIGGFVLLALLVGLERERRRKRDRDDDDDAPTLGAVGGSTVASTAPAGAASGGLWFGWMGKRSRADKEAARDVPLAAEQWDDTGSAAAEEEPSYLDDLRLMAMVEVGQEEDDDHYNEKGPGTVAAPSGDEPSPTVTAKTGATSSASSTTSEADTDKSPDDGSVSTSQAIGAGATHCPQPACFASDHCTKTAFASIFGYYRALGISSSKPSVTQESHNVDSARGDDLTVPDVEEAPQEFEPDRSWNPDDNSVGSTEVVGSNLFEPFNPSPVDDQSSLVALASAAHGSDPFPPSNDAPIDDQSSLVALASQNSGSSGVRGVLSYRMMPVEITPDEDLIDVPLRPVTFQAADTVNL